MSRCMMGVASRVLMVTVPLTILLLFSVVVGGCNNDRSTTLSMPTSQLASASPEVQDAVKFCSRIAPYVTIASAISGETTVLYAGANSQTRSLAQANAVAVLAANAATAAALNGSTRTAPTISENMNQGFYVVTTTTQSTFGTDELTAVGIAVCFDSHNGLANGLNEQEVTDAEETMKLLAETITRVTPNGTTTPEGTRGILDSYKSKITKALTVLFCWISDPSNNSAHTPYAIVRSEDEARRQIRAMGFKQCSSWASSNYVYDYTKGEGWYAGKPMQVLPWWDCPKAYNAYRTEAAMVRSPSWRYYLQYHEPNPEILSYISPTWWWVIYVAWWHQTH